MKDKAKNNNEEAQEPLSEQKEQKEEVQEVEATPVASEDPLDIALAQVEELQKQLLYKAAEFENFRKRTISEKTELILNGGQNVVRAILPVLDDMERAIDNAPKIDDIKVLEEGWELIAKKLTKVLSGLGVEKIATEGADFNTDYHEAVAMIPNVEDGKKGKVIDCVQAGYTMNDKVLRHAKVAVGE